MTIEELQAEVEKLSTKNRELLGELKAAKAKAKGAEIDPEEYEGLKVKLETVTTELEKVTKASKLDAEKLNNQLKSKDTVLQKLLIEGGLTEALVKVGTRPELMAGAKALLAGKAQIKVEGDNYSAVIGDKSLLDSVKEWSTSDEGKAFIKTDGNGGGGAGGSGGAAGAAKTITRTDWDSKTHVERTAMAKEGFKVTD